MNKSKDQILLENIYANMGQTPIAQEPSLVAPEDKNDFDNAEKILSDALERNGVYVDPTSEVYRDALDELVAAIQHSPEETQENADKIAMQLDRLETGDQTEDEIDHNEISEVPLQQYESKTILNAYEKVLAEAGKVNPYAVCTITVGRKDEKKYKSCKKKVAAGAKKSGKSVTSKPVK